MAFGEKLKVLMRDQGLTQSELSALTGVGKSSISQYLSGKNEPAPSVCRMTISSNSCQSQR